MTTAVTMADLSRNIAPFAGRPVMDKTGLTGAFDIDLTWEPEEIPGPDGTTCPVAPSTDAGRLFTAIQEQLGLKLEAQRGPVDVIVIDSAQRPIED